MRLPLPHPRTSYTHSTATSVDFSGAFGILYSLVFNMESIWSR